MTVGGAQWTREHRAAAECLESGQWPGPLHRFALVPRALSYFLVCRCWETWTSVKNSYIHRLDRLAVFFWHLLFVRISTWFVTTWNLTCTRWSVPTSWKKFTSSGLLRSGTTDSFVRWLATWFLSCWLHFFQKTTGAMHQSSTVIHESCLFTHFFDKQSAKCRVCFGCSWLSNIKEWKNEKPRLLLRYIIYQLLKSLKFMHSGQAVGFCSFQPIM